MAHQDFHDHQDLSLVLSSDAKPRLKWNSELHQRFVEAVTQLGGPEKATPKSLRRVMDIQGLTLYHLKSHLQKYRLGKIQQSPAYNENLQEDLIDEPRSDLSSIYHNDEIPNQIHESLKIAQTLQMQMEVQRKLHEQIVVQRHLQLRIEAQGKYLQSVLRKAQDTLASYNSSAIGVEIAKSQLSQLASMVDSGCLSFFDTENGPTKKMNAGSSLESSLTSSESFHGDENDHVVLPLMEMSRDEKSGISNFGSGRKRSRSMVSDGNCVERCQPPIKSGKRFDLNSQYVNEFDFDLGSKSNDLKLKFKGE